tara:strand:- start:5080 stop:5232 length:153 start_codon:yes stop_codon:yes gene_type:complete
MQITKEEGQMLFLMLEKSTFLGKDSKMVYDMLCKLDKHISTLIKKEEGDK